MDNKLDHYIFFQESLSFFGINFLRESSHKKILKSSSVVSPPPMLIDFLDVFDDGVFRETQFVVFLTLVTLQRLDRNLKPNKLV